MNIRLVVFDLAGTTVDDLIEGMPLVTVSMMEAFRKAGFSNVNPSQVNQVRGMGKKEAISKLLNEISENASDAMVDYIFKDFKEILENNLNSIKAEIKGTTEMFKFLKNKGVKIALGSGFPQNVVDSIVKKLNWVDLVDFVSSAEKEGRGRPDPVLILSAMRCFGISDARSVIKVGDTKMDVKEGKNAGCWVAAVLTGTQTQASLTEENPDFIIDSINELPSLISEIEGRLDL